MDDKQLESAAESPEYVRPTVVDYGDIVQITAANQTNNLSDVPIGTPENHGFS